MYVGPQQQVYPGGQTGVVVIQPSGAVATVSHGYSMTGQQTFVIPPQVTMLYVRGAVSPPTN